MQQKNYNAVRSSLVFLGLALLCLRPGMLLAQGVLRGDVETIPGILAAVYDSISGDAGVARDWDRFRELFTDQATLSPVTVAADGSVRRVVMSPELYIERSGGNLERNGFHEIETHRIVERFGNIAHVFSTYESRRRQQDPQPFARGINSFQLMHDGERWWVVSIYWQSESDANPIPARYGG